MTKKQKQHPAPGDDASTPKAASGRVGRYEQDEARRANTTPNGGPHLELGRLRRKTWSKSDLSIAETTGPPYLYTYLYMCFFFLTSTAYSLQAAGLFSCSRLQGTQGARPNTAAQVLALPEVCGTCFGCSKSRKVANNHREAFRAHGAIQAHKYRRTGYKMSNGLPMSFRILLTARPDCLPTAHLVPVLECTSCSCSSGRGRALVLVLPT